jgi:outer membrane lipoprotein SlyB
MGVETLSRSGAGRALRWAALGLGAFMLAACVTEPPPRRTVAVAVPPAPKIYAYPAQGQSPEQQDRDQYECHNWAVQQTGVDPSRANGYAQVQVQSSGPPPGANTAAGAIGGAIIGSIIAGPRNAGFGALFGGATGAVVGSSVDANNQAVAAQQNQAQINRAVADDQNRVQSYRRAISACLQGRGYTVS